MAVLKSVVKQVFGEEMTFVDAYHQITSLSGNKAQLDLQVMTYND